MPIQMNVKEMFIVQFAPILKRNYKYKNIAAALAVCLLLVLWLTTSCSNKALERNKPQSTTKVVASSAMKKKTAEKKEQKITANYRYEEIDNRELSNGTLVLVDDAHKYGGKLSDPDTLYSYLFSDNGTQIMFASTTVLEADRAALTALQKLVGEYYSSISDTSLLLYSTTENPDGSSTGIDESQTGLTFDFMVYDEATGGYASYTGDGKSSWILANANKYGMILRYPADKTAETGHEFVPNHFRYVGVPHSEIMAENSLCLDEYLEFLKKYTFEKPLSFTAYEGDSFEIYYVGQSKDRTTKIPIPQNADGKDYSYSISGNNYDGFIVTVNLSGETEKIETKTETAHFEQTSEAEEETDVNNNDDQYDYSEDYTADTDYTDDNAYTDDGEQEL